MKKLGIALLLVATSLTSSCKNQNDIEEAVAIQDQEITILALGDNLMHLPVVNSGKKDDGTYEYSHIFENLQPEIQDADIAVIGQETIFGGDDLRYSGYPLFNTPTYVGDSIVDEGFDVVLHASNHALDQKTRGIENTLEFWRKYPEMVVLGINENEEEKDTVEIMEIKGAKIAMLNYTYGANGFLPPKGKEYLVNFIDEEKIEKDLLYAEENADFTVVFLHWGEEYRLKPTKSQEELALKMCELGTDLIIGAHPHVLEPAEWIEAENGNKCFVYYSLGNFVSRQLESTNLLGGMAKVKLLVNDAGVSVKDCTLVPIVTHYDMAHRDFTVYRLSDYTDELASEHGLRARGRSVSIKKWNETLEKIFEDYDIDVLDYDLGEI